MVIRFGSWGAGLKMLPHELTLRILQLCELDGISLRKETCWKAFLRLLVCESGCRTRGGVSCVVHCKHMCVCVCARVCWAKLSLQMIQISSLFTVNNLLLEQTRVCLVRPQSL